MHGSLSGLVRRSSRMTSPVEYLATRRKERATQMPSDAEAEKAFQLLLEWIGEDPSREGLLETPARAVRAWKEFFAGYKEDPRKHLEKTFEEVDGFQGTISLDNIRLETFCEHHLVPIIGEAFIAYVPNKRVVGISKLARVMEGFAKRLQIQERLTAQIAQAINDVLQPRGVAVAIRAAHGCITTRGIHKTEANMMTSTTLGCFETDASLRNAFLARVNATV